jgi:glycosyltransferase involved in cell wall biosynthesis
MKVMHVMAGAKTGGAENIFLEDVLALAEAGVQQYVVTRPNNSFRLKRLKDARVPTATAWFSAWYGWPTTSTLRETMRTFKPEIIQYWMGRAGSYAEKNGAKTIGWYGGYYDVKRFRNCDHHIGLTRDIVRHIVAQGVPLANTGLIHTYADFQKADPVPRAELNTPEGAPLLLSLARLHWKKGLDILLRAMVSVPAAYLWIAGEGPLGSSLESLAAQLGISKRVRFLGWRDDRARLLAAADVCVFPSRYEPFGTVMVDAWAAGVPLIAAAAQGPKAYLETERNGLLVDIDDIDGLANAISRVISEKQLRDAIVAGGTGTYNSMFTKAAFVRDSLAFYERVLKGG